MKKGKRFFAVFSLLFMLGAAQATCSAADYALYLDIHFTPNLFFSTYDVDVYLDDEKIDTIPHGKDYTRLIESIAEGYHTVRFCNVDSENVYGEDIIEVKGDTTFCCSLYAHSYEVTISDAKAVDGIEAAEDADDVTIPAAEDADDVTAPAAEDADDVTAPSADDAEAGSEEADAEALADASEKAADLSNVDYSAKDIVAFVQEALNGEGYDCGTADGVAGNRTKEAIRQYRSAKGLAEGEQIDRELVDSMGLVSKIQDLLVQKNGEMTEEEARRAVIVAMTNLQASDIFSEDGMDYDFSKLHNYAGQTGDYMELYEDGAWTQNADQSRHVEDIILYLVESHTYLRATADISFNGTDYVVSNVYKVLASLDNIYSDDPSKVNIEELQPEEDDPFLMVSPEMIRDDRDGSAGAGGAADEGTGDSSWDLLLSEDWQNWHDSQLSLWDGAPTVLEDLVKDALNDEKSYKFIDVEESYFITQEQCDNGNGVLEEMGSSVRLEPGDIMYTMRFSAKNAFNATIKNTAYGIAKYSTNMMYLLYIE